MCLGAIYWARPDKIYYAADRQDASQAGFDDSFIYEELDKSAIERKIAAEQHDESIAREVFREWVHLENKIDY